MHVTRQCPELSNKIRCPAGVFGSWQMQTCAISGRMQWRVVFGTVFQEQRLQEGTSNTSLGRLPCSRLCCPFPCDTDKQAVPRFSSFGSRGVVGLPNDTCQIQRSPNPKLDFQIWSGYSVKVWPQCRPSGRIQAATKLSLLLTSMASRKSGEPTIPIIDNAVTLQSYPLLCQPHSPKPPQPQV